MGRSSVGVAFARLLLLLCQGRDRTVFQLGLACTRAGSFSDIKKGGYRNLGAALAAMEELGELETERQGGEWISQGA